MLSIICSKQTSDRFANSAELSSTHNTANISIWTLLKHFKDANLNLTDLIPHSVIRIQVREEIRKNSKLAKEHRCLEVQIPIVKSRKRKRKENEYMRLLKYRIQRMSNENLDLAINNANEFHKQYFV